ncbi:MAG: hypothetical protein HFJ55_07165 [Clostridia bacterium]|nr:hypothetical protein [Clostridia bacterium]
MIRELVIQTASELSENATIEEIFDAILIKLAVKKGLKDFEDGNSISHEDLLKEIETW